MDNYITLAELRKTAEALLIKTNNELENKVSIEDINAVPEEGQYYYKVASIGDKDLIVDEEWVGNIAGNIAGNMIDNYQPPVTSVNGQTGDVNITIPSVPSWALAAEKPTYTAAEVGALPDSTVIPEDKIFIAIRNVTTYTEVKSAVDAGKVVFAKDGNYSSSLIHWRLSSIVQNTTPECFFVDISGYDGADSSHQINYLRLRYPNNWYQNYWTIPYQTSNLTNDSDFQTSADVNSLIATAIGNINSFNISVVSELPSSNIDTHTIYFLSNSGASPDSYDEYMYINSNWEKIGNTAVDLSGYVVASNTKGIYTTEIARSETGDNLYFKTQSVTTTGASNDTTLAIKPQYAVITAHKDDNGESTNQAILVTATETTINNIVTPTSNLMAANKKYVDDTISAATSSHVHGSITNSGDITTTATIGNGDRLVINDESASKITNSSITFGTSTTQYLANNGTWQSVPTTLPASDVYAWAKAATKPTYTAAEVGALPDTTVIPDVPSWALAATKPTYTASEVGAAATNHTHTQLHAASPTGDGEVSVGVNLVALTASSNGGSTQNRMTLTSTATTIHNIVTPTENGDAANKKYVDDKFAVVSDIKAPFIVTFTYDETLEATVCDKTYTEICNAIDNGNLIIGKQGSDTTTSYQDYRESGANKIGFNFEGQSILSSDNSFTSISFFDYLYNVNSDNSVTASGVTSPAFEQQTDFPVHIIQLTYYNTINDVRIYSSEKTNAEVMTMIDNHEIVILVCSGEYYYFSGYDRGVADLYFIGGQSGGAKFSPYKLENNYTNYWRFGSVVTQTLSSGTLIATINGTNIYAPSYTDADGVSY